MLERLLLTIFIVAALGIAYSLLQRRQRQQAQLALSTDSLQTGEAILYFRSDACPPCVTQKRFLDELQAKQDVQIETIDVVKQPERASAFNILTLPTTIVINGGGEVKEINYGLADAAKLARQLV